MVSKSHLYIVHQVSSLSDLRKFGLKLTFNCYDNIYNAFLNDLLTIIMSFKNFDANTSEYAENFLSIIPTLVDIAGENEF